MRNWLPFDLGRRKLLGAGLAAAGGAALAARSALSQDAAAQHQGHQMSATTDGKAGTSDAAPPHMQAHGAMITVGDVDNERNGFDPTSMLTDWDLGTVSTLPDGRRLRTFEVEVED